MLLQVLDSGRWAPSPDNKQPWRMVLISNTEVRRDLIDVMKRYLQNYVQSEGSLEEAQNIEESLRMLSSAPLLMVVCMTKDIFSDLSGRWLVEHVMGVQSVAAAIQNILLVAHEVGLGGCWSSTALLFPTAVRKALDIPQSLEPQAIVALGYPDEAPQPPVRKSFDDVVFLNRWGQKFHPHDK